MGAFFICKKQSFQKTESALGLFAEMGFSSPCSYEVGEWDIFAYHKMVSNTPNSVSTSGCTLILIGTAVYRGLDYSETLSALLQDYINEKIDFEQLFGHYTLLFCHGDTIEILCDPLGSKHLFTDIHHSMLSSHMLPICHCFTGDLHINRKAFYEKLLTGIIMSPNTIFREIIQIDKKVAETLSYQCKGIKFFKTDGIHIPEAYGKSLSKCLDEQVNTLRNYFKMLSNSGRNGIDIGLSGGYDSRLGLACLHKFNNGKIHLHSHATENVHQKDLTVANLLANYVGEPCHIVKTKKLSHCNHVDEVLRNSVLYFDGRKSFSIGGCGEVYTASYRKESTEKMPFTLTGMGGELYRNVFDIGFKHIRFERFMEDKVFSLYYRKAIPDKIYRKIRREIINKSAARLGINPSIRQSKLVAYRYYCEIMMPDGQGIALDAYNQVSCCIAPFLEPMIIEKGYRAIPFHYSGGEFEGKLIDRIDSGLASLPSTYGYPIGKRPFKARLKERLRAYIPSSVWGLFAEILKRKEDFCYEKAFEEFSANSRTLKEAYTFMTELFPEIDFTCLLRSSEGVRELQFFAMTFYSFKGRIK